MGCEGKIQFTLARNDAEPSRQRRVLAALDGELWPLRWRLAVSTSWAGDLECYLHGPAETHEEAGALVEKARLAHQNDLRVLVLA